jgi:hypothetical protein
MYNDVQWVVVDEVDTLLQEGYVEHLDRILQPLLGIRQTRKGSKPLNFVFVSATVGKDVQRAIQKFFPVRVPHFVLLVSCVLTCCWARELARCSPPPLAPSRPRSSRSSCPPVVMTKN